MIILILKKMQQQQGYHEPYQNSAPSAPYGGGGYPQQQPPPGFYNRGTSPGGDPEGNLIAFNFSEKTIRMAFIRKVYAILMVQLIVTSGFICMFVLNEDVKGWFQANPIFMYVILGVVLVITIALACCEGVRRKAPGNFICLGVYTIAEGFLMGSFSSYLKTEAVLIAVGITAVVCLALTVFSFQTKCDFTGWGSALFVLLIVFMLFGILVFFLRSSFPSLHIVYAALGALLFSFYLIYDTQLMLGGKHKYSISPEEYIFAALSLYVDIINIFMYILSIVGLTSSNN